MTDSYRPKSGEWLLERDSEFEANRLQRDREAQLKTSTSAADDEHRHGFAQPLPGVHVRRGRSVSRST